MKGKGWIIILGIIGIGIFLVFGLPLLADNSKMQVTFYDEHGDAVGHPLALVPLGTVTIGGIEISEFDITVFFSTTNPNCDYVEFTVMLEVNQLISDNPLDPQWNIYWDGVLWESHVNKDTQPNIWSGGHLISPKFDVSVYCSDVPEDATFTMRFTGDYAFWNLGVLSHADDLLLHSGVFSAADVVAVNEGYEYTATLGLPWT
jgi:hypothetical protein